MHEQADSAAPAQPDWVGTLLGFKGRIRRHRYLVGIAIVFAVFLAAAASLATSMHPTGGDTALLGIPLLLLAIWMLTALSVKRWRDAGRSPALLLLQVSALGLLLYPGLEVAETMGPVLLIGFIAVLVSPALASGAETPPSP